MPRRPLKVPDPTEFDHQRSQLWRWLRKHGHADPGRRGGNHVLARRAEVNRIACGAPNRRTGAEVTARARAVASALLRLDLAAVEREAATWYSNFRAETMDKAGEAARLVQALRRSRNTFAERAGADRPSKTSTPVRYGPDEIGAKLAAAEKPLERAIAIIDDYGKAVATIDAHLWGSMPNMIDMLDSAAIALSDGGFSYGEIGELLDKAGAAQGTASHPDVLLADRWGKRINRAKMKMGLKPTAGRGSSRPRRRRRSTSR